LNDKTGDDLFLFDDDIFESMKAAYKQSECVSKYSAKYKKTFTIPPPKLSDARWVQAGERVVFGGYKIDAGLFYFGTSLSSYTCNLANFPALLNPNLAIPKKKKNEPKENPPLNKIDYAELTGIQRRKFISWLCGGRTGDNIQEWFVLLFLYGLERRVLVDGERGLVKQDELITIRDEARRIFELYGGGKNTETRRAYSNFLAFLELKCGEQKLYDIPLPLFERKKRRRDDTLPVYIDVALFQCAKDGVPVNPELACYWYILGSDASDIDLSVICEKEFKKLFMLRYAEAYGAGFSIKVPKKAVPAGECRYIPECGELHETVFNIPDGALVVSDRKIHKDKLEKITERCNHDLMPFMRWLAKSGPDVNLFEGDLKLPPVMWEGSEKENFLLLKETVKKSGRMINAGHLKKTFFKTVPFSKSSFMDLARSLEAENIALEPDILSFPSQVNENDTFMIYMLKNKPPSPRSNFNYEFSKRVIELAVSVIKFYWPDDRTIKIYYPIKLDDYFYDRLFAYINLLLRYPPPLQRCINRVKNSPDVDKKHIIRYIRHSIPEDRRMSYEAVSVIERLYSAFGLPAQELYSTLHNDESTDITPKKDDIELDKDKIKQLQSDSDHVFTMLSEIFQSDDDKQNAPDSAISGTGTPGNSFSFDDEQVTFLKIIISRPQWRRDELDEQARQHNLMLDGLVEIINEAAYDEFDEPLMEGDEIITVNASVAGMMTEKL
jgi:hypothetical protein